MTAMVLHQSYVTQHHSVFVCSLIACYAIVFSFAVLFTDGWFKFSEYNAIW